MALARCASAAAQRLAMRHTSTTPFGTLSGTGVYFVKLPKFYSQWSSDGDVRHNSTVANAQPFRDIRLYNDAYRRSLANPEDFWGAAAEHLVWEKKWTKVLDDSNSPCTRW